MYEPIQYDHTIEDGFGVVIQAVDDDYCTPVSAAYVADTDGYVTEIDFVTPIALSATQYLMLVIYFHTDISMLAHSIPSLRNAHNWNRSD